MSAQRDAAGLVEAGAILPGELRPAEDDRDLMSARHYRHPALVDRTVVRLVPESLGAADDLTMSYLGFQEPARVRTVGIGRRQALGFPAWALVNDPANAHHALNLVKELERLARQAKSSPGNVKDRLMVLGGQLGRSAPHFLPTFYEQAGRIFLAAGSTAMAAAMFGKARDAEDVHGLAVDAQRQRAVFLEFAFAGALTAKATSAYARTLLAKRGADEAYELFRTLCVERTRGGLPPYRGMPEDLRRLAKAAGRTRATEDMAVLRAVLDTSAIVAAGTPFWMSYRAPLVALAKSDPAIRFRLLSFVPADGDGHQLWLEILTECGAVDALVLPAERAEATPSGPAGWLSLFAGAHSRAGYRSASRLPGLLALTTAMAERLIADGTPVALFRGWSPADLDLVDLCLDKGIPLEVPARANLARVSTWYADTAPGAHDLTAVGAHPRFGAMLADGVIEMVKGHPDGDLDGAFEPLCRVPGLAVALDRWLTERAARLATAGMGWLEGSLARLAPVAVPQAFVHIPDVARRIAAVDVVGALTATLRGGLVDELGWPALEEGVRSLIGEGEQQPSSEQQIEVAGQGWPALALLRGERVVVVGPDGVLLDHVVRIPAEARRRWGYQVRVTYVDGRLLVVWPAPEALLGYWSDAPDRTFVLDDKYFPFRYDASIGSIPLPGGGVFTGGRALHPGDGAVPRERAVLSDGVTYWALHDTRGGRDDTWREVDIATGDVGRASRPAFLEEFTEDDAPLRDDGCDLRPVAPGTEASPLGAAGGLHGWRLRKPAVGWVAERIDGERCVVPDGVGIPRAGLRLPGDDRSRPVLERRGGQVVLLDPDGTAIGWLDPRVYRGRMASGTDFVPPLPWWHCLRPRDEAGSRALRSISRDQVGELLAAALAEREDQPERRGAVGRLLGRRERSVGLPERLRATLPEVTHPRLALGLLGVLRYAAWLQTHLISYRGIAEAAEELVRRPAQARPETTLPDAATARALNWMDTPQPYHRPVAADATVLPRLIAGLAATARARAAGEDPATPQLPETAAGGWSNLIPALPALAYRAASTLTPDTDRPLLLAAADVLADDMFTRDGHWRQVIVEDRDTRSALDRRHKVFTTRHGFVMLVGFEINRNWQAVQFTAKEGDFALPAGWRVVDERPWLGCTDRAWLARFGAVLAERGPAPWRAEAAAALVDLTGMSRGEAVLLLAGLPHVGAYQQHFLSAQVRATLGLKATEASAARERLKGVPSWLRYRLVAAAMPVEPEALWTTGPDVAGVARLWLTRFERRAPVSDDLLVAAAKALPGLDSLELVSGLADPAHCGWLDTDATASTVDAVDLVGGRGFQPKHFAGAALAVPWLAYVLPVGDPIRAGLPAALDRVVVRSGHREFRFHLGATDDPARLCRVLGIAPEQGQTVEPVTGVFVTVRAERHTTVAVAPSALGPHDATLLQGILGSLDYPDRAALPVLLTYHDPAIRAACAAVPPEGTDPGAYFQDPTLSAPAVVTAAADRFGLSVDAAALYVQLLALADPTDANVARWTGWRPARLAAARAELAATDLVLTAKRARAGRSLFLPGGWLALRNHPMSIEEWKKPMFRFASGDTPIGPLVPARPLAEHFDAAWQRIERGDVPGYVELRTGGRS